MSRQRFIKSEDDIQYVNASLNNTTDKSIVCEYSSSFSSPIVDNAGEYYVSIVRFNIPNTLPIFKFVNKAYNLTFTFNGTDFRSELVMESADKSPVSNFIYTFQQFANIINTSLIDSYNQLKIAFPGSIFFDYPYLVFNQSTNTFSFFIPKNYQANIDIYFNNDLMRFFEKSFHVENYGINLPSQKDYKFIIQDYRNNTFGQYYEFKQQISTLYNWYDLAYLLVTTSSLPITNEIIATKDSEGLSKKNP